MGVDRFDLLRLGLVRANHGEVVFALSDPSLRNLPEQGEWILGDVDPLLPVVGGPQTTVPRVGEEGR
jgi:hypothetical protein